VRANAFLALLAGAVMPVLMAAGPAAPLIRTQAYPAPAFTQADAAAWINSPPLTWQDLKGGVTLVEFWTFACWNCYRSIPWLRTLEPRYRARGLRIVSVHTPEFPHESVRANVEAKVREHHVEYPVMLDNDFAYWNALGNQYWPAFYLVDRQGRLRASFVGETHAKDRNAVAMEAAIEALLTE